MDVEDLLSSDKRILDLTRKEMNGDQHVLVFDFGELGTLTGAVPEKLDASIMTEWCMAVRREWNARNNKQKAAKPSEAADVRSAPVGAVAPAGEPAGSGVSTPPDLQGAKAAMAEGIEAALAGLGRRRKEIEARSKHLSEEIQKLRQELSNVDDMVGFYERMLENL